MADEPMTLAAIRGRRPKLDRAKIAATTEADIRRHQIEDGEDPDAPPPPFQAVPNVRAIRTKLQMTQDAFAQAIGVPVATLRNWEQSRTRMDPAVRPLLRVGSGNRKPRCGRWRGDFRGGSCRCHRFADGWTRCFAPFSGVPPVRLASP
jgi:putative transcriptional regulator